MLVHTMKLNQDLERLTQSRLFISSLKRGLDVLMAFDSQNPEMNLPDISKAAGITVSAAQRYAYTLEAMGFLQRDPKTKQYSLTPKIVELGYRYLHVNPLIEKANPFLQELSRTTGETVNLSVPHGSGMVYIARFPTNLYATVHMPVGCRLPMFCTASGRAFLSLLDKNTIEAILESEPLHKYTPTTVTNIQDLKDIIDASKIKGYAVANAEYYRSDLNIAVAITNTYNQPIAALNISAPTARWSLAQMEKELLPHLINTGRQLSAGR